MGKEFTFACHLPWTAKNRQVYLARFVEWTAIKGFAFEDLIVKVSFGFARGVREVREGSWGNSDGLQRGSATATPDALRRSTAGDWQIADIDLEMGFHPIPRTPVNRQ